MTAFLHWISEFFSAAFNEYRRKQSPDLIGFAFVPRVRPIVSSGTHIRSRPT
jgi:hypothetical protein